MSDTPELDDLIRVANAAVAIGRALQRRRDELNQIPESTAEAGAAGCRDLIVFMTIDIRDAAGKPIEIVAEMISREDEKAIRDRPATWSD